MRTIPLGRGYHAIVDDDDYPELSRYRWYAQAAGNHVYARRFERTPTGPRRIYMHRQITDAKRGEIVDHANRNGLDNRRSNLRICTRSENGANSEYPPSTTSRYRGVSRGSGRERPWRAVIVIRGVFRSLGQFATEVDAARAYDAAAIEAFGPFARPNFPQSKGVA